MEHEALVEKEDTADAAERARILDVVESLGGWVSETLASEPTVYLRDLDDRPNPGNMEARLTHELRSVEYRSYERQRAQPLALIDMEASLIHDDDLRVDAAMLAAKTFVVERFAELQSSGARIPTALRMATDALSRYTPSPFKARPAGTRTKGDQSAQPKR
ncbi:MAG: hypothetical protein ABI321_21190 [Polyangia bacterium]